MVQVLVVIGFVITVYLPSGENFVITFTGTSAAVTMDLHLTDEQAALLLAELDRIIENDRFPLSRRIKALREIRALLKPYPVHPPRPPPPRQYEPPSRGRFKKRR
jgi:hypothetical protein